MNDRKRTVALLCAFVLVFSTAMSGCAKKVKFEEQTTTEDNKIRINTIDTGTTDNSDVVIGEDDGQSFLVDGEDSAVVYDATSEYVIPDVGGGTVVVNPTTAATKTTKKATTKKTIKTVTEKDTTQPTTSQQDKVYSVLASRRQNIDDKAGNDLSNYSVNTLDVRFENGGKEWAVKLIKGKYDSSTIGCETCVYVKEAGQSNWQEADDADRKNISMTLWQKVDDENYSKADIPQRLCWWTSILLNGKLYGGSNTSLTMKSTITFSTETMKNAFCDSLEEKNIKYGDTKDYKTPNTYSTDGRTVTIIWNY